MKGFFIKWVISSAALCCVVAIIPGISVARWDNLLIAALVLSLLNNFIRPILMVLTLPLQILSLGVFTLLMNGFLFFLAAKIVDGFYVDQFGSAFWGALLYSIVSFTLNYSIQPSGEFRVFYRNSRRESSSQDKNTIDVEGHVTDDGDEEKKKLN